MTFPCGFVFIDKLFGQSVPDTDDSIFFPAKAPPEFRISFGLNVFKNLTPRLRIKALDANVNANDSNTAGPRTSKIFLPLVFSQVRINKPQAPAVFVEPVLKHGRPRTRLALRCILVIVL